MFDCLTFKLGMCMHLMSLCVLSSGVGGMLASDMPYLVIASRARIDCRQLKALVACRQALLAWVCRMPRALNGSNL
jgi:hypothetical protein